MSGESAPSEDSLVQPELSFWNVLFTCFAIVVATAILQIAVVYAGDALEVERGAVGFSEGEIITIFLAEDLAILGGIYLVLVRLKGFSWGDLGLLPASRKWLLWGAALGVLTFFLSFLVEIALELLFDVSFSDLSWLYYYAPFGFTWTSAISITIGESLFAPFCEELFFRGVLYGWMRRAWGVPAGLIVSAAFFAVIHGIPVFMPEIFLSGIILAWIYERSGSLLPPILLHMTLNLISFVYLYAYLSRTAAP